MPASDTNLCLRTQDDLLSCIIFNVKGGEPTPHCVHAVCWGNCLSVQNQGRPGEAAEPGAADGHLTAANPLRRVVRAGQPGWQNGQMSRMAKANRVHKTQCW